MYIFRVFILLCCGYKGWYKRVRLCESSRIRISLCEFIRISMSILCHRTVWKRHCGQRSFPIITTVFLPCLSSISVVSLQLCTASYIFRVFILLVVATRVDPRFQFCWMIEMKWLVRLCESSRISLREFTRFNMYIFCHRTIWKRHCWQSSNCFPCLVFTRFL